MKYYGLFMLKLLITLLILAYLSISVISAMGL